MRDNQEDFNCDACNHKHCDIDKKIPGSNGPAGFDMWQIKSGNKIIMESNICPLPMITQRTLYMISLHKHYKNSVLPCSGGLLDQPNYYLQVMELLG